MNDEGPVVIANEFATVTVRVVETGHGVRLRIESVRLGRSIDLDPLELETLTWQTPRPVHRVPGHPFGPEAEP